MVLQAGKARVGSYLLNAFNERIDLLLVTFFFGASVSGNYFMAARLVKQPLSRLSPVIATIALPVFRDVADEPIKRERYYREALKLLSVVIIPVVIFMSVNLSIIVPAIIGEGWELVPTLGAVLSVMVIARLLVSMTGMMMLARGHFAWVLKWQFITFLLTTSVLLFGGIASLDIITFAIGQCCAYGASCLLTFYSFQRINGFDAPHSIIIDLLNPLLISCVSVMAAIFFASRICSASDLQYLFITFISAATIYFILVSKLSPTHYAGLTLLLSKSRNVLKK
jgi:O-antigen/teichoic acid export membrane protein